MPKNAGSLATIETNGIGSERVNSYSLAKGDKMYWSTMTYVKKIVKFIINPFIILMIKTTCFQVENHWSV